MGEPIAEPESAPDAAKLAATERGWCDHAPQDCADWTSIDFRRWPRGLRRSAWIVAGYVRWNPLGVLHPTPPAARAVNAIITRRCLVLTAAMTHCTPEPGDAGERLLAWFNAAVQEHQHDIAAAVEVLSAAAWKLPASPRRAARGLVAMWERGGVDAFGDPPASPAHARPPG